MRRRQWLRAKPEPAEPRPPRATSSPGPGGPGAQRGLVRRSQVLLAGCLVRARSAVSSPTSAPLFFWETPSCAFVGCCATLLAMRRHVLLAALGAL